MKNTDAEARKRCGVGCEGRVGLEADLKRYQWKIISRLLATALSALAVLVYHRYGGLRWVRS